ncbi:helix-turn-helix domain-containing protein [Nocardia sp. NPDC052566]|uniref:helix-turn-helix domain-containing protein n=1 Tax=Nocardia sp. NPDC052566 TaxID=3364330 RepID=UPI0037CC36F2
MRPPIGRYLRERRTAAGLTVAELATKAGGVSPTLVADFEEGARLPAPDTLHALFDALCVPFAYRDHIVALTRQSLFITALGDGPQVPQSTDLAFLDNLPFPAWYQSVPSFDLVAANYAYRRTFRGLEPGGNILQWTMLDPRAKDILGQWDREAHLMVNAFRIMSPGLVPAERWEDIVRACRKAPEWERMWNTEIPPAEVDRPPALILDPLRKGFRTMSMSVLTFEFPYRPWWMYTLQPTK